VKAVEEVLNSLSHILGQLLNIFTINTLELWDNNGNKRSSGRWRTGKKFATQFKVHEGKGNQKKQRLPYYWIVIRVCTSESVKGILLNQQVKAILADKNAHMTYTDWTDAAENSHITSMVFLIQYDPKNCSSSQAKRAINNYILEETGTSLKDIPKCNSTLTSVGIQEKNTHHRTLTYDALAQYQDADQLRSLMEKTFTKQKFKHSPRYCLYSIKKDAQGAFKSLVDYQFDYTADMLTIAVEGIPREHMNDGFGTHLRQRYSNIVDIYDHNNTDKEDYHGQTIGRRNIMSKTEDFNKTSYDIHQTIAEVYFQ